MKKNVVASFFSLALVSSALPAAQEKLRNPDAANGRIIFAANYKKHDALHEALDDGGTVLGAERECYAGKAHFEEHYGKGACERIKDFAAAHHALESSHWRNFWYAAVPATIIGTGLAAVAVHFGFRKMKVKVL